MKRKSVFLSIAVLLILLAIYGIWHYSPLRYLTQSKSEPDQIETASVNTRTGPVIITKKILPEPENTQQTADLPKPLVVLKKIEPNEASEPIQPRIEVEVPAAAEKKTPLEAPEVSSSSQVAQTQSQETKETETPQQPQNQTASLNQDSIHPYSIMLSSCRLPQSAQKIVSDYKKVGLAPYIVKVKFESGDEWLRVLTGHYQTRREAIQAKKKHQLSGAIIKRTPYTNLIGTYTSMDKMKADMQQIKTLGYSPYFLKTQNGELKLLVGAFVTKEGAANQQAELQAKGIKNTVTIR